DDPLCRTTGIATINRRTFLDSVGAAEPVLVRLGMVFLGARRISARLAAIDSDHHSGVDVLESPFLSDLHFAGDNPPIHYAQSAGSDHRDDAGAGLLRAAAGSSPVPDRTGGQRRHRLDGVHLVHE